MAKLSVDRVVKTTIWLQPRGAARRNFGILLIVGASEIITPAERIRSYTSAAGVAADFGIEAPEYQAAQLFFSQSPRPAILMIGRWVKKDAPAQLVGAILGDAEAEIQNWTAITNGVLTLKINNVETLIDGLDFSGSVTLEGIAEIINQAAASKGASCAYDGSRFIVSTLETGKSAVLPYATGALAERMRLTAETALDPQPGMDAETIEECVIALVDRSGDWYGLTVADQDLAISNHLALAALIQAQNKSRIYAATITDSRVLDEKYSHDLGTKAQAAGYTRTILAYSQNPYAIVSALGRAFTVNFSQTKSTITLKFKQLPGVVAENLGESQARALEKKRVNVFVNYDNDTAIFQEGVMSGDAYFDEIHGLDWLQNAVQNKVWNLEYQTKTKIGQTDTGANQFVAEITAVLDAGVNNNLIASGIWNGDSFGLLEQGDRLESGYYVHVGLVDEQDQSEREQRKSPPIRVAAKLAGAIHSVDIDIDVVR